MKTGTVLDKGRNGRPGTNEEDIDRVREALNCCSAKSIRTLSGKLKTHSLRIGGSEYPHVGGMGSCADESLVHFNSKRH